MPTIWAENFLLVVVSLDSTHSINKLLFEESIFKAHIQKEKLDYFSPILFVFLEVLKSLKRDSDFFWYAANKN